MAKTPLPTTEAVPSVVEKLAARSPKARDLNPNKFFEDRFIRQLQAEKIIDSLYRLIIGVRFIEALRIVRSSRGRTAAFLPRSA